MLVINDQLTRITHQEAKNQRTMYKLELIPNQGFMRRSAGPVPAIPAGRIQGKRDVRCRPLLPDELERALRMGLIRHKTIIAGW